MKTTDRVALALALVFVATTLGVFVARHHGSLYDDAYIYLRYVENFRNGLGFRFNAGEDPVEGFSSPLFLGILLIFSGFSHNLEAVSQTSCTALLFAGIAASFFVALALTENRATRLASFFGLALLLSDPFLFVNSVVGLDAPAFLLTFTLLSLAVLKRDATLTSILSILCFLARFEGIVCVLLLPILRFEHSRRRPFLLGAAFLGIVLGRLALFGEFAPNTFFAKSGGTFRHFELGLEYLSQCAIDFPVAFLAPLALLAPRTRRETTYILLVSAAIGASFLKSGGDLFPYSRFFVPLVPTLSALALVGLAGSASVGARRMNLASSSLYASGIVCALSSLLSLRAFSSHALAESHGHANVLLWKDVGLHLRRHEPNAYVATVPIGAIGYFSKTRILDLVGLTEPVIAKGGGGVPSESLKRLWIGHERHDTPWVLSRKPDLVVTTKFRATPWTTNEAKAGFIADVELLRLAKAGAIPYRITSLEVRPNVFVLALRRTGDVASSP